MPWPWYCAGIATSRDVAAFARRGSEHSVDVHDGEPQKAKLPRRDGPPPRHRAVEPNQTAGEPPQNGTDVGAYFPQASPIRPPRAGVALSTPLGCYRQARLDAEAELVQFTSTTRRNHA
jgi:hypothetical protein